MANADMLTMRKRYVFPGWKGRVAFSLNPTALVTGAGFEPAIGPRYVEFWAKYINPDSERMFFIYLVKKSMKKTRDLLGTGSAPPGFAMLMNCFSKTACSS